MPLRASPSGSVPWRRCLRAGAGARAAPPRCGWAAPGLPPCARTIRCRCGCSSDRRRCCWPSSRPRGAAGTGGRAVGGRHPLAALAVPARAGTHLLLRVLLPPRADRRAQRAERLVARGRVPARSRGGDAALGGDLGGADIALAGERHPRARGADLVRPRLLHPAHGERLASSHLRALHALLLELRQRRPGLLQLPVRRHVARGWIHLDVLRAGRAAAGPGRARSTQPVELVPARLGMAAHLLRVGCGQAPERRSAVARADRPRSLLREPAAPELDRLVRATAPAALVPPCLCRGGVRLRASAGVDGAPPSSVPARLLLPRDPVP